MREELRQYLHDNGVKQSWVAEQLGVTRQMMYMYLSGKRNLGKGNMKRLREILDKE